MKFIHFITIITLCVKFGAASPLIQLIENEDEALAKGVSSISSESKSSSSERSSEESPENITINSLLNTRLYPINTSAIALAPFLQDELRENFVNANNTQTSQIQSFGIRSAFNLPWLADLSFHQPNSAEHELLDDINITVSGELFQSNEENVTTTISDISQQENESTHSTIQNSTTTLTTPPTTTTTTKKINSSNATVVVVSTTESIKEKLIVKIAEIAAEPIILTQGVR